MTAGLWTGLSLLLTAVSVSSQDCISFTTPDVEGPFFVSNVPRKVMNINVDGSQHFSEQQSDPQKHWFYFLSQRNVGYNILYVTALSTSFPLQYKVAPDSDIQDPSQAAVIRGKVTISLP